MSGQQTKRRKVSSLWARLNMYGVAAFVGIVVGNILFSGAGAHISILLRILITALATIVAGALFRIVVWYVYDVQSD